MTPPLWWKRNIIRATTEFEHDAVIHAQRVLRINQSGEMDETTIAALRGLQHLFGLRTTGILDGPTAEQIERLRNRYAV